MHFSSGDRGNSFSATYLRPANDNERQAQRRAQAREFSGRIPATWERDGLRINVIHHASSLCSPKFDQPSCESV